MGGSSKSSQKAEGDVVFNNVDYGGGGGGTNAFKNFNIGRENTLEGNVFNVTDSGATKNALAANIAAMSEASQTVRKGTEFALSSNTDVATKAIDSVVKVNSDSLSGYAEIVKQTGQQVTDAQVTSQQATGKALDYVFQSSKSAEERQTGDLIKYGTLAAAGLAGVMILTVSRR